MGGSSENNGKRIPIRCSSGAVHVFFYFQRWWKEESEDTKAITTNHKLMDTRKMMKGHTIFDKTVYRKHKSEQREPH